MNYKKTLLFLILFCVASKTFAPNRSANAELHAFLKAAASHTPTAAEIARAQEQKAKDEAEKAELKEREAQKAAAAKEAHKEKKLRTAPAAQALLREYFAEIKKATNLHSLPQIPGITVNRPCAITPKSLRFYATFFAFLGSAATHENSWKRVAADSLIAFYGSFITQHLLNAADSTNIENKFYGTESTVYPAFLYTLAFLNHALFQNGTDVFFAIKNSIEKTKKQANKNPRTWALRLARAALPFAPAYLGAHFGEQQKNRACSCDSAENATSDQKLSPEDQEFSVKRAREQHTKHYHNILTTYQFIP